MKKQTPKVGDLIVYNSAGMRRCSLGLLLEVYHKTNNGKVKGVDTYYRILWAVPPRIPPRKEWASPKRDDNPWVGDGINVQHNHKVEGWYRQGGWFEVQPQKK